MKVFDQPYWRERQYTATLDQLRSRITEIEEKGGNAGRLRTQLADLNAWILAFEDYQAGLSRQGEPILPTITRKRWDR